jgi:hypothetical protein
MNSFFDRRRAPREEADPLARHIAASKLDVFRHERLAYTEMPARRPAARRWTKLFLRSIAEAWRLFCRVTCAGRSVALRCGRACFRRHPED